MPMDTGYSRTKQTKRSNQPSLMDQIKSQQQQSSRNDMQPTNRATNPTGKGGALGLLTSRLEQGLAKKKKRAQMQNMQSQQGLTSRALGKARQQGQMQDTQSNAAGTGKGREITSLDQMGSRMRSGMGQNSLPGKSRTKTPLRTKKPY